MNTPKFKSVLDDMKSHPDPTLREYYRRMKEAMDEPEALEELAKHRPHRSIDCWDM